MNRTHLHRLLRPTVLLCLCVLVLAAPVHAAKVTIVNGDGPGEGFNDPTVVAALPGNSGTTLGAQRLNAFQAAANQWGSEIISSVEIFVYAALDPLPCNASAAVLGAAGPNTVFAGFPSAPVASTWYPAALANSIEGSDLCPGPGPCGFGPSEDIDATFNSTLDTGTCLGGATWWYGVGAAPGPGQLNFVETVRHELAHGLGVSTLVDLDPGNGTPDGEELGGLPDIYETFLEDHSTGVLWPAMATDGERAASAIDDDLHWIGSCVTTRCGYLQSGADISGHVAMYSPNPLEPGSSVSHWDTILDPDELMEPFDTPNSDDRLTHGLLKDVGWNPIVIEVEAAGDVNSNGTDDIAVLAADFVTGETNVLVMDGDTGLQIKKIPLTPGFSALDLEILDDFGGTGAKEIAVLLQKQSTGEVRVLIKDAFSAATVSTLFYSAGYQPIDFEFIPDYGGTSAPEIAVLHKSRSAGGWVRVTVRDASTNALLDQVYYSPFLAPIDLEIVSNFGGTARDELAVLGSVCSTANMQVDIRDGGSGSTVNKILLGNTFRMLDIEVVPSITDASGTSADEIAILGRKPSNRRVRIWVKDAQNGYNFSFIPFPDEDTPVDMEVMPNYAGTAAAEIALLARSDVTGKLTVRIRDGASATLIGTVNSSTVHHARDLAILPDISSNGIPETVLMIIRQNDSQRRAIIKDATDTLVKSILIP